MHKRPLLRTLLAATLAASSLVACGFRLRGTPDFAFRTLYIEAPADSALVRELRRALQGAGDKLTLLTQAADLPQAQAVLHILSEQQERVAVGLNAAGQVRELQLRLRLRFRLHGQQGQEWIAETELLQQRDISYSESTALSKEGEEAQLFHSMRADLVQQLMRRLAAIQSS